MKQLTHWILLLALSLCALGCGESQPRPQPVAEQTPTSQNTPTAKDSAEANATKSSEPKKTTAPADSTKSAAAAESTSAELQIAAASDLRFVLEEILAEFRKQHPETKVTATYGSSGNFFAKLSNEAPFDVFLSADMQYPQKLIEQDRAFADSEFLYALGHIVLWVPKDSPLEVEKNGVEALLDERAQKVAIANPQLAPYGRAAVEALKHLKVHEQIESKLVLGENITQTAQFLETGAADIGVIALSLALAPAMKDKGRYWSFPADAHAPLKQGGVILKHTKQETAARALIKYLQSSEARTVMQRYGFELPGE